MPCFFYNSYTCFFSYNKIVHAQTHDNTCTEYYHNLHFSILFGCCHERQKNIVSSKLFLTSNTTCVFSQFFSWMSSAKIELKLLDTLFIMLALTFSNFDLSFIKKICHSTIIFFFSKFLIGWTCDKTSRYHILFGL